MSQKHTALMAAVALIASQELAGIYYEAKTTAAGRKGADMQNSTVRAWVAGDKAKVLFTESEHTARHDIGVLMHRLLDRELPVSMPAIEHLAIPDLIGNRVCTVGLVPLSKP